MKKRVIKCLIFGSLLINAGAAIGQMKTHVLVEQVKIQKNEKTDVFIGQTIAIQKGPVAVDVAGTVEKVLIKVGDIVKKDQILVELEKDSYKNFLNISKAKVLASNFEIKRAAAFMEQKQQELIRERGLKDSPAYSKGRLDDLEKEAIQSKEDLNYAQALELQAKAELSQAELNLTKTTIRAPYAGTIIEKFAQPGQYLVAGDSIATLVNHNILEIECNVPSNLYSKLEKGQNIKISSDAGADFLAKIRSIPKYENMASRTITLRLVPNSVPIDLLAGQAVSVYLNTKDQEESVITVHKDAIIRQQNKSMVYVLVGRKVQPAIITLGEAIGKRFIVKAGLSKGQLVVVNGNERLFPGQEVNYKEVKNEFN